MPMRSQAQRSYLHIHEPAVAEEFERKTPKGKKLPYKVKHKKKSFRRMSDLVKSEFRRFDPDKAGIR
jgi:hypothetical protein